MSHHLDALDNMMSVCEVIGCNNRSDRTNKNPGVEFYRFPQDHALRNVWISAVNRKHWEPSIHSCVCSKHFSEKDVSRTYGLPRLKENAVPTIFLPYPDHLKEANTCCSLQIFLLKGDDFIYMNAVPSLNLPSAQEDL